MQGLLPVCQSWEDECWAHARCLLQTQPSALLQQGAQENAGDDNASDKPWSVSRILAQCGVAPVTTITEPGANHASDVPVRTRCPEAALTVVLTTRRC